MLVELSVRDIGVIDALDVVFGRGLIAFTGETGAGKTLIVEAIEALLGGKVEATLVRPGADAARVTGRFVGPHVEALALGAVSDDAVDTGTPVGSDEVVVERVIPAGGRSRGYVDGRPASLATLVGVGSALVDLHGQHAHQSLLSPAVQRDALDRFGAIDTGPLREARARLLQATKNLAALGGDERERMRELDVLRFQQQELAEARLDSPDEDDKLAAEESLLARVDDHRHALRDAHGRLRGDGGAVDEARSAMAALADFAALRDRVGAAVADIEDTADAIRGVLDGLEADPERLAAIRERRHSLRQLRRKYGDTLAEVMAFATEVDRRVEELDSREERVAAAELALKAAEAAVVEAAQRVSEARVAAAPVLGAAIEAHLPELALPKARVRVLVEGEAGEEVTFQLAANPGEPFAPLAKVASGGELARVMLATRLVLSQGPPVLVFDEVDAGIGGEAALALGAALSRLGETHQVFVVTHLAQVAACADQQWAVEKVDSGTRTVTRVREVRGADRVTELSRMLSGTPDSSAAREHAAELLARRHAS